MKHDWILDVLTDLRSFAKDNDLLTLDAQLEDTQLVAAIEIATLAERAPFESTTEDAPDRPSFGGSGQSKRIS